MADYFILYNGQQVGPMPKDQLLNYGLNPNSQVWKEGLPQWVMAYTIPELMEVINRGYQPTPGQPPTPAAPGFAGNSANFATSGKSNTAFGLFAILLGTLGVQYFYVGKVVGGILTILLSIVTCGLWGIVTLIQGILALTMTQQQFEQKYVNTTSAFPLF